MYHYKQVENNQIVSVEAKSKDAISPDFIEASEAEYNGFIASLPEKLPDLTPARNLMQEFDDLKAELKAKSII